MCKKKAARVGDSHGEEKREKREESIRSKRELVTEKKRYQTNKSYFLAFSADFNSLSSLS
jgi:hypothetical protein